MRHARVSGALRRVGVRRPRLLAVAVPVAFALSSVAVVGATAPGFSSASAHKVQPQPRPGTCHARGTGLDERPDPRCTPGLRNPAVTPRTIFSTICKSGWTSKVRPPESITAKEKRASMAAYGDTGSSSTLEYDHFIPLELGGAVNAAGNLWPEPDYAHPSAFYLNPKDHLEDALKHLVCSGRMPLATAQKLIVTNWVIAYRRYG
jgi:hypothetical protein